MNDISQGYDKEVAVVETAYAHTLVPGDTLNNIVGQKEIEVVNQYGENNDNYSATVQGQANVIRKVMKAVNNVPNNKGIGIFYWEGLWIPVEGAGWETDAGNAWENQAVFDYDGNALGSLDVFNKVIDE